MSKKSKVLYPGSFDPITYGHIDVIKRALHLFDEVIVAVATNTEKNPIFSLKEKTQFIERVFQKEKRVKVKSFKGLSVRFAEEQGVGCMVRGLRAVSDFEYEFQMALANRKIMRKSIESIFLMPSQEHFYVSSRLIKEIATFRGPIEDFVPSFVAKSLKEKISRSPRKI